VSNTSIYKDAVFMERTQQDVEASWERFLHPDSLRSDLIVASLYLAAWETLKTTVIERARDFYWCGFDEHGDKTSPEYQKEVVVLHKSLLKASLLWLQRCKAIDATDIDRVEQIREHRNEIAHHLPEFIASQREVNPELIIRLCEFVGKVERWWLRNVEMEMNPEFDNVDTAAIPDSEIMSGRMIFLHLLLTITTSEDEEAMRYYKAFVEAKQKVRPARKSK
jgi:hypothetical protein